MAEIKEITMCKITLIEDINKVHKLSTGTNINVNTFDTLYDMNVERLEIHLQMVVFKYELMKLVNEM